MTLKELRARLKAIVSEQEAIVNEAGEGDLSEEQEAKFDALSEEFERVDAKIQRLEKLESRQQSLSQGNGRQTPAPSMGSPHIEGGAPRIEDDPMRGFTDMADLATAVMAACNPGGRQVDQRLEVLGAPSNFHRESGEDGFMVPPQLRNEVWELVMQISEDDLNLLQVVDPGS